MINRCILENNFDGINIVENGLTISNCEAYNNYASIVLHGKEILIDHCNIQSNNYRGIEIKPALLLWPTVTITNCNIIGNGNRIENDHQPLSFTRLDANNNNIYNN